MHFANEEEKENDQKGCIYIFNFWFYNIFRGMEELNEVQPRFEFTKFLDASQLKMFKLERHRIVPSISN